jgi:predicted transcriptional regulator
MEIFMRSILFPTKQVVESYVARNPVSQNDLPSFIRAVGDAFERSLEGSLVTDPQRPAVPITRSVTNEHLVCLEDGQHVKLLTRHLRDHHGMTPEEYRRKWHLSPEYPMTAPSHSSMRSNLAKKNGLGSRAGRGRHLRVVNES